MGVFFLSTYNNKIDAKGRVSMPASFRDIITKTDETSVIIYKSLKKKCLEGSTKSYIEKIQERLETFDMFSSEKDAFETAIFAESVCLEIDKDGRINIPKQYTQFANIENNAFFVGKGSKFEIWKPEEYEQYSKQCRDFAVNNSNLIK